jgi:pimeloyl-ACP methyl ester carboxylesterase
MKQMKTSAPSPLLMVLVAMVMVSTLALVRSEAVKIQDQAFGDDLWVRDFKVPTTDDPSLSLFVRNKYRRVTPTSGIGNANRTLIFIAGATYPTSTAFDLMLGGTSWMDFIARNDYDVWMVDQRGYVMSCHVMLLYENMLSPFAYMTI